MEEITIMNTKLKRLFYICSILLCLTACQDKSFTPSDNTSNTVGLRFHVADIPTTRISYNNNASIFENNDAIGCIIATKNGDTYSYTANSRWHYMNGYLILDEVFTWGSWDWGQSIYPQNPKNDLIQRTTGNGEDGFLTLLGNDVYAFYFYYPYVDNDILATDFNNSASDYQSISYPNYIEEGNASVYVQCILLGAVSGQSQNGWYNNSNNYAPYLFAWTECPCFTNHTQMTKRQTNFSDFLWVSAKNVSQSDSRTYNLTFQKKTATIAISADEGIEDIYLTPNGDGLIRGKQINLQNGEFTSYKPLESWESTPIQRKYMYFDSKERLTPYYNTDGDRYHRITFVPQESFPCSLHFTSNNEKKTIDLSTNISSLEEGFLYVIHITQAGETTLEIVDWQNEHFEILHPEDAISSHLK